MLDQSIYLSALLMGLLGGGHCAGMCGPIVSAMAVGVDAKQRNGLAYPLLYNSGRILSYLVAGIAVATMGEIASQLGEGMAVRRTLTILAGGVMILLGLYLSGWWPRGILLIERGGSLLWRLIEPIARRFIPIRSPQQALIAGALWGWIPCGLVYTALLWALAAESTLQGGMIMVSFGIGTLPTLLGISHFSSTLIPHLQKPWVRSATGIMVASFGILQLYSL